MKARRLRSRLLIPVAMVALAVAALAGCHSPQDKPEGTIRLLFEKSQKGEMDDVRRLISTGQLDEYDIKFLTDLLGAPDVRGLEARVIRQDEQKATVALTLVTDGGKLPGQVPLDLVWRDGAWKIDYAGWSWPTALKSANFRNDRSRR